MMDERIDECLKNSFEKKYVLPFFWQHGSSRNKLLTEMDAIHACGIREFCVESRTYEDFCGDGWWSDFGLLLEEARQRDMKVWLLDDKTFPTGYANGYIEEHPELRKLSLKTIYRDFAGTGRAVTLISPCDIRMCVSVMAYRRTRNGHVVEDETIDLIGGARDGLIRCTLPAGMWRVYWVYRTRESIPSKLNYIDMLSEESCRAMIHAVYQPTYEHFSEYFGKTFKGFFSDEPSFANAQGSYHSKLGTPHMLIPWNDDLLKIIARSAGISERRVIELLPALWHDIRGATKTLRYHYMDAITKLYRKNFCCLLGDWCRNHGVMYIGHVIEDMNTHQRLGYGSGHFFRSLDGQDMAGLDIVLHQIAPGVTEMDHVAPVCGELVDPEFFNYALAKLATSHAHINPRMQGRTMCEIFGGFGWAEGLPFMKQLVDHMLVNGVNYFVPHAFSDKYPNPDAPPHFHANGNNPQFELFGQLMEYTQRMGHLLDGGVHCPDVAVFYNAEAEWADGDMMLPQTVAKTLTRSQIDFDIVPTDYLTSATVEDGRMIINGESYGALIVPYSEILSAETLQVLRRLACQGLPVLHVDACPSLCVEGPLDGDLLEDSDVVPLAELVDHLRSKGICSATLSQDIPLVRFYHYRRSHQDIYMLKSEDLLNSHDFHVTLPDSQEYLLYNAWENRLERPEQCNSSVRVQLGPGGCAVLVSAAGRKAPNAHYPSDSGGETLHLLFDIAIRESGQDTFAPYRRQSDLHDITSDEEMSRFCGMIRYEAEFATNDLFAILDLGQVGETAKVWLNGTCLGSRICAPYAFDVRGLLVAGRHHLVVEVNNNLGYRERDPQSTYVALPASGLLGPITLIQ